MRGGSVMSMLHLAFDGVSVGIRGGLFHSRIRVGGTFCKYPARVVVVNERREYIEWTLLLLRLFFDI